MKPGAFNPTHGMTHTPSDDVINGGAAFRVSISAPGTLIVRYAGNPSVDVPLTYPVEGVYYESGQFVKVNVGTATVGEIVLLAP